MWVYAAVVYGAAAGFGVAVESGGGALVTVVPLVWGRGPLMHLGKVRERLRFSLVFLVDVRVPLLLLERMKVSLVLLMSVKISLLFLGRPLSLVLLVLMEVSQVLLVTLRASVVLLVVLVCWW